MAFDTTVLAAYIPAKIKSLTKTYADSYPLLGMFPEEPFSDDTQFRWDIMSGYGNPAVVVPEGGGAPADSNSTTRTASTATFTFQDTAIITGEAMSTEMLFSRALDKAIETLFTGYRQGVEAWLVGRLVTDLAAGGNVYGLARAANNLVTDIQPGGGIAVTEAGLAASYNALQVGFREAPLEDVMILSTPGQRETYTSLAGIGAAAAIPVNFNLAASDLMFDLGRLKGAVSYNGRPWMTASTLTNTVIYFLHASMARILMKKPFEVIPLARTGYPMSLLGVAEVGFKYENPGKASAITGLLAA